LGHWTPTDIEPTDYDDDDDDDDLTPIHADISVVQCICSTHQLGVELLTHACRSLSTVTQY